MRELYIVVEGFTEETFVKGTLSPHLERCGVWARAIQVTTKRHRDGRKMKGGGDWTKWHADIRCLFRDRRPQIRVTTLFDLYGLPSNFPSLQAHSAIADTVARADRLEEAMAAAIGDTRFLPYLQRHEFEALVFAALENLRSLLEVPRDVGGLARLMASIGDLSPEDVNDGPLTAPSKRLAECIPSYDPPGHAKGEGKSLYGPLALEGAGLAAVRARCPRFDRWVTLLEALGGEP